MAYKKLWMKGSKSVSFKGNGHFVDGMYVLDTKSTFSMPSGERYEPKATRREELARLKSFAKA